MSALVVDASVVAKWFLDETNSPAARGLLDGGHDLAAPDLLPAEIGNVLLKAVRRGELPAKKAGRCMELLRALPVDTHPVAPLAVDALALAQQCRLAYFDAIYAALAVRTGALLVTADESLVRALRAHALERLVQWIGDPLPAP